MQSFSGLIVRLEKGTGSDRKLDSEVVAAILAPPGCVLDPVEGLDGWDIQYAPDDGGEAACWREAADIPPLTAFLDSAVELLIEAEPTDASCLLARALRRLEEPGRGVSGDQMASRAARGVVAELLRSIVARSATRPAQAA